MSSRRSSRLILGTVLLLALLLRVWPLTFPVDTNPDEEGVVTRALRMGREGPDPRWYRYPPLFLYTLFGTYGARYAVERATGRVSSARAFAERYFARPLAFFVQGRLVSTVFGVLAVWALYLLARRLSLSRPAATGAALFLAVSPLAARLSHFALTDMPTLLPMLASMILAVRLLKTGRGADAFWAGVLAGLAAAVKYPAGAALAGVLAAAAHRGRRKDASAVRLASWGIAGAGAGFLIVFPWAVLNFELFRQYVFALAEHVPASWPGAPQVRGYGPYLLDYAPGALGRPVFLAGIVGLLVWLRRDPWRAAIAAAPALLFWLVMGAAYTHFPRFALPMLPAFALGAAWWIDRLPESGHGRGALLSLGAIVLVGPPLAAALIWNARMALPDTRRLATAWFEHNVPAGARVLSEDYGPRLAYTPARAREIAAAERARNPDSGAKFTYLSENPPAGRRGFHLVVMPLFDRREGVPPLADDWYDPARVRAAGIQWVALSSHVYGRYAGRERRHPRQAAFGRWLARCWEEVVRFSRSEPAPDGRLARRLGRTGPTIRIFRPRRPAPATKGPVCP